MRGCSRTLILEFNAARLLLTGLLVVFVCVKPQECPLYGVEVEWSAGHCAAEAIVSEVYQPVSVVRSKHLPIIGI